MKKKKLLSVLVAAALGCSLFAAVPVVSQAADTTGVTMYRLYNPNSGEHFYTANDSEWDNLVNLGWRYEGIGWYAPESSNTPVYRLYNPNTGDHHFTTSSSERQMCIDAGWKDENIGWYSDDAKSIPLYREYNPNVAVGTHNYTTSKSEHDNLVSLGWKDEGIGWYGITEKKDDPVDEPEDPENPTDPEGNLKIGDNVILGTYEQDNDLSNGPEPIEWQVIGTRDGHTLLLSKYALDGKKYHESQENITWENCTLRSWLNNDFYNAAFSASDKSRIVTAHNENPDSYDLYKPWNSDSDVYGAEGGNATDDNVFLLSWTEARDYLDGKLFDNDLGEGNINQRIFCSPTAYAEAQGASGHKNYIFDTADYCDWWLRSPGEYQYYAAYGSTYGLLDSYYVHIPDEGVRPALLID